MLARAIARKIPAKGVCVDGKMQYVIIYKKTQQNLNISIIITLKIDSVALQANRCF